MTDNLRNVKDTFFKKFANNPDVVAVAPGRVNIIGEHTDYTGGLVLPIAIDRETIFAVRKRQDKKVNGYSLNYNESVTFDIGIYNPKHACTWLRYVLAVLDELEKAGHVIGGFDFVMYGNVPIGSGLSSSAAFELAVCTAMQGLFGFSMSGKDAALLCQRAENKFIGVNCGIMDQYISSVGKKDHAVKIDCRDLSVQLVSVNAEGYVWVVIDSKKKRGLVDSEYNNRRRECEEGLQIAQASFMHKKITGLRDLTVADLPAFQNASSPVVYKRIKHVVTENERVENTVKALAAGDIAAVGKYLYASHASLRDDFEVSCDELNAIVDIVSKIDGVAGARLTGAGFGGCVIALVKEDAVETVKQAIAKDYHPATIPAGEHADVWPVKISEGARLINS